MEIKETNLQSAYNTADENGKQMLRALFPEMKWIQNTDKSKLPVTERIKTFGDACYELGDKHPYVQDYLNIDNGKVSISPDILAYLKLRIICAALNEGWEPKFTKDEWRYYPWFYLYTNEELSEKSDEWKNDRRLISTGSYEVKGYAGLASAYSHCILSHCILSHSSANIGSRLCLKSNTLASYCGKQFIELWADLNLIRR